MGLLEARLRPGLFSQIFGGADDPRLSASQNDLASRRAMIQAGLATLASSESGLRAIGQGGLVGQQAGEQGRQAIYGRTAEERITQALRDPKVLGKLSPDQQALVRVLPPMEAVKIIQEALKPQVVGEGGALVDSKGGVLYENAKAPDLPADLKAVLWANGVDPNTIPADKRQGVLEKYTELKKAGSTTVNLNNTPEQKDFTNLNALAGEFRKDAAAAVEVANSFGTVLAAAKDPSPSGDLALITSYMKMIDPGTGVKEGEFANAQNAGSIPERVRAAYNKALSGERLTPDQRADFVGRAKKLADQRQTQLKPIIARYTKRAQSVGLDPSLVLFDPFDELGAQATVRKAPPGVGAPAPGGG